MFSSAVTRSLLMAAVSTAWIAGLDTKPGQASKIPLLDIFELTSRSDLIVLAQVVNVQRRGDVDNVTIRCASAFKGKLEHERLHLRLTPRGVKGFDPEVQQGQTGVFFLTKLQGKQAKLAYPGCAAIFLREHFLWPEIRPQPKSTGADGEVQSAARWNNKLLSPRVVIEDHGDVQGAHVLSVVIELKNKSGHAVEVRMDPRELAVEVLDSAGKPVTESYSPRSGPIPTVQQATIWPDCYVGLATYRGGIGLSPGKTMLAAGFQDWILPAGKYTVRAKAAITWQHQGADLDPLLPGRNHKSPNITPVGETRDETITIPEIVFEVKP